MNNEKEPDSFGYCWHRDTGEFYYGIHLGTLDDGYVGSGIKFQNKFGKHLLNGGYFKRNTPLPKEWHRTIEFRGTYDECSEWEKDMVNEELLKNTLCLNLTPGGKNPRPTMETRKKMSIAHSGENNPFYGKTHSEETKLRISKMISGENNPFYGKTHSEETKKKMSNTLKGRVPWNKGKSTPFSKVKCDHCGKFYGSNTITRYHNNNCKSKRRNET